MLKFGNYKIEVSDSFISIKQFSIEDKNYFYYDFEKDGIMDRLIISKGNINSEEESYLNIDEFASESTLISNMNVINIAKMGGEKPSNTHIIYLFASDRESGKIYNFDEEKISNFNDKNNFNLYQLGYQSQIESLVKLFSQVKSN